MKISRVLPSELPSDELESLTKDSFFASPGFLSLWKERGGVPVYWAVWLDDNLVAVLPGVEFGMGVLKRFHSTPNGCYGKLCLRGDVAPDTGVAIASLVVRTIADYGYVKIFLNDFYGCFTRCQGLGFDAQTCQTRLVDISDPDWQPPRKQLRYEIRRAERQELKLEAFDFDRHFDNFLTLVRLSAQRLGIRQKYSVGFFRELALLSGSDERVRWIWCEHQNTPVASNIFFVEGDSLLSWQVYFDPSLSHTQGTKLIKFATARYVAKQGIRYMNMGASHVGVEGLSEFKRGWGGGEIQYTSYSKKSLLGRLL